MNKEAYLKFHREACDKLVEITKAKNADYTGAGDDPFANFSRVEQLGICSAETGFLTRMTDKFSRMASGVEKGSLQVKDESFEDTCFDLANYAILLAGYVRSKRKPKSLAEKTLEGCLMHDETARNTAAEKAYAKPSPDFQ